MEPRYQDGDLVITSPDEAAIEEYPCVAHQKGQIGANCKIFQRDERGIVLIPLNETFAPQHFDANDVLWAHRVLYSVRLLSHR